MYFPGRLCLPYEPYQKEETLCIANKSITFKFQMIQSCFSMVNQSWVFRFDFLLFSHFSARVFLALMSHLGSLLHCLLCVVRCMLSSAAGPSPVLHFGETCLSSWPAAPFDSGWLCPFLSAMSASLLQKPRPVPRSGVSPAATLHADAPLWAPQTLLKRRSHGFNYAPVSP